MKCPYCLAMILESDERIGKHGKFIRCITCGANIGSKVLKTLKKKEFIEKYKRKSF